MRSTILATVAALALAAAGTAAAGGWATVGIDSQPPTDGSPWDVNITVLQHGVTPLGGVTPTLTIRNAATGEHKTFTARPTGKTGVYRTTVVFPSDGTWKFEINDGFVAYGGARAHTFAPVTIAGAGGDAGFPVWQTTLAVALGLALAGTLVLGLRRRRPSPAPVPMH